jgi:hypothetical protein
MPLIQLRITLHRQRARISKRFLASYFCSNAAAASALSETELGVCDKNTGRSIKYSES